jgi:hypothetical protein
VRVSSFVLALALDAAARGRLRGKALVRDIHAARHAYAVVPRLQSRQCGLHLAQLLHVAMDGGEVEIRKHAGNRIVALVAHETCKVDVMLSLGQEQLGAYLVLQYAFAVPQNLREMLELGGGKMGHGGDSVWSREIAA